MNNFYEGLKKYFETTPREQVLKDWEETAEYDTVGITVDDFMEDLRFRKNASKENNQ